MVFVDECVGAHVASGIAERQLVLLENVRMHEGEKANDPEFAKQMAKPFDIYINDAFGAAHRTHASVSAITEYLPSYAGFLMEKEVATLSEALTAPAKGKVMLLGGAKIGTKLPVIRNFLDKAETILVGGALINNFYKFERLEVGKSLIDEESLPFLKDLPRKKVILPEDVVVSTDATGAGFVHAVGEKNVAYDEIILDVGPKTANQFADIIRKSEMIIWNGPMGKSEVTEFAGATRTVIEAIAASKHSIIGGGDTIAAVNALAPNLGLAKFSYVSTGGGAMLDFLGGLRLPALETLGYYK
jgi:phosphoglycerate kinase